MKENKALLLVDIQNDFCSGGKISVPKGDSVVPACNAYIKLFAAAGLPVFASRDWHPEKTKHFQEYGGIWPAHCVQNTLGAEFHPNLKLPSDAFIISKGQRPEDDSYSAFQGRDESGSTLDELFKNLGVLELYVGGLATDFCVKHSVLDGLHNNYSVHLLTDAIKGVNMFFTDDIYRSVEIMERYGAIKTNFENVLKITRPAPAEAVFQI
jgi:nicotinamidase/pyrazinamidase